VNRVGLLAALIVVGVWSVSVGSQRQPASTPVVELQKLKENLYLLTGGGGNSAAFVTDLGVVLVDTKLAGWGQPMLDKLKTVTAKPVTTIINTHAHAESVEGNEFFPTSVEIIAHETTRLNLDKLDAFKGVKVNFLPKLMFRDKMSIGSGKDRVDLFYFGAGHTGGDAWVVFPAARVMHAGDMLMSKQPPIIDLENGGSGLAYPETLAAAARMKNIDAIIPSHGPMMTMKDVEEYAQFNKDFRDAAVSGFNHGLGISEVAGEWKLPEKYRGYTATPERVKANVHAIFSELTR
jgi:glyoxylase-like metal-dependent hydrolase (beta-lactamase superfamily II)